MAGNDRCLQLVWPDSTHSQCAFEQSLRLLYRGVIPGTAILVGEQDQRPIRRESRVGARQVESHQGQQADRFRLIGHQANQQRREPCGVLRQVAPLRCLARRCEIALVEYEIEDSQNLVQPSRKLGRLRNAVGDRRVPDLALGANDPLGDGRFGDQEGLGHRRGLQTCNGSQRERDLGLPG